MTVYIQGSMLPESFAGLVKAEITAVHENGVDMKLEDGSSLIDWRMKVYDMYENEISLDEIRRKFVPQDDLQARIRAIEILLTEV